MNSKAVISSMNNPQIKNLALLQRKAKARNEQGLFVVEGRKMVKEAIESGLLSKIYMSESFYAEIEMVSEMVSDTSESVSDTISDTISDTNSDTISGYDYELVTDTVFKQVSDTMTPQGVMATVRMPSYDIERVLDKDNTFLLLLEDIRDPGNLGTIIRSAEGAGVSGIILNGSCADIFQPKVVRSTMGSIFRVPYYETDDFIGFLTDLRRRGFNLFAAHLSGISYDTEGSFLGKCGLLIGNEGSGLSKEASSLADKLIRIPMEGKVESLNAAIAAAILMYEAARQRRNIKED